MSHDVIRGDIHPAELILLVEHMAVDLKLCGRLYTQGYR